jgi:hypothetical protein
LIAEVVATRRRAINYLYNKMKYIALLLVATTSAIKVKYNDLPHDGVPDKVDPLSRYVNDEDVVQLEDDVSLVQYNDLPHDGAPVKVDPLSRYVNDEDVVQLKDEIKLLQLQYNDLPHDGTPDKVDPLSRYVNDEDVVQLHDNVPNHEFIQL